MIESSYKHGKVDSAPLMNCADKDSMRFSERSSQSSVAWFESNDQSYGGSVDKLFLFNEIAQMLEGNNPKLGTAERLLSSSKIPCTLN